MSHAGLPNEKPSRSSRMPIRRVRVVAKMRGDCVQSYGLSVLRQTIGEDADWTPYRGTFYTKGEAEAKARELLNPKMKERKHPLYIMELEDVIA